ncbi:hypothetical protein [Sphingomonas jeddahensis]|uniref:Uncharacterized protein n=1 Tax=Sphingomonas jeddahensis TaxID=1915074 RepID=A0A1V2EXJ9_9SPHN|nr:hypothetical protein [Sphingomonas jeddahensis]ONF97018.1 hypothetical protein SPHI_04530 [Sphingomonas jeddahensis]
MKKQVSGVAGAARIKNLDLAGLARAEKHGKRLDQTGKARAMNDLPPLTTTGLDLLALYDRHIEGAFVPRAKSSVMHILIQFPTELVDGEDPGYMLHHARVFAERVFGDEAILADRLDRDEKSRHVVDLFVAPRYMKSTKRESKPAISTTHHLKALAKEYGEKPLPFGYGRALQTAFFDYMRDEMKLDGVERGKAKAVSGNDWKSAEQQRLEELDGLEAQKTSALARIEQDRVRAEAAAAEAAHRAAEREEALAARERKATERERAIAAREIETAAAGDRAAAARLAAEQARIGMEAALQAARLRGEAVDRELAAAAGDRADAEADRALAAAERAAITAERERNDAQRKVREAQLALLARAADDGAGLDLRSTPSAFSMRKDAMLPDERHVYEAGWPASLVKAGRQIAVALEQVRAWTRRLLAREKVIEEREAALAARERDAERERAARHAEHAATLAGLDRRDRELAAREQDATTRLAAAEAGIAAAAAKDAGAQALLAQHSRWAMAVDTLVDHPDWIDVTGTTIRLDRDAATAAGPRLAATLREPPPPWALNVLLARLDVADRQRRVGEHEQAAASSARQLTELLGRAGPVLTPEQQLVAAEVQQAIRRSTVAARAWNAARDAGR